MANEELSKAEAAPKAGLFERKPWLASALKVVVVLVVIGAVAFWWYNRRFEDTDDAQVDGHIYPVSARVSGHIVKVNVEEGQFVKAGTVLVEIDDNDYKIAVERAQADYQDMVAGSQAAGLSVPISQVGSHSQIHSAEADVINAEAGVITANKQVEEAQAKLVEARARAATANADRVRYATLVKKREVSQQQFEQVDTTATAANATVQAATASLHSAQEMVKQAQARVQQAHAGLANAQVTPKQIAATEARARSGVAQAARAKALLEQAQLNLSYTKIVAPVDGVVGNRNAQVGQNVQPGQEMLSLVPRNDVWITADFKETQLQHMKPGQAVSIAIDALGGRKFTGTVTSIGGATGARFSLLPPENATGNYVKVVQRVPVRIDFVGRDQPNFNLDGALRPGLSVVPTVRVR